MKTLGKILALLIVGLGLLSAIAVFYKTQVSMPETPPETNPHLNYLRRSSLAIVGLSPDKEKSYLDSTFFYQGVTLENVYHRQLIAIKRFYDEKLLSSTEYNNQLDTLVWAYSQAFLFSAREIFRERMWTAEDRKFLVSRAMELNRLVKLDGQEVLSSNEGLKYRINRIITSCKDYVTACNLLIQSTYTSMNAASSRIQSINNLIEAGNLDLNSSLIDEMRAYPSILGDSHKKYLEDLADQISNWQNYSLEQTNSRYNKLVNDANSYTSDGAAIYGGEHPYDVSDLLNSAASSRTEAIENLSTLIVDGFSSDIQRNLNSGSGTATFTVSTNYPDGYSLSDTDSKWFSINSHNNSIITVSFESNDNSDSRSDYFTVKAGKKSIKVELNQDGSGGGNRDYLSANSNKDWTLNQDGGYYVTARAISDGYCDLDITITDRNGNQLGIDESNSKNASVRFYAPYTGTYTINVKNCSNRSCNYVLIVNTN